ncbi:hypothetical protein J4573_49975 [Actinomadura barringtoniae]|uniref:Uncharacterized protein n=1 Tax=Actinomadura barringtoniae TaxID=1427535 RepID=A0A939TAD6_9ACTN|nr:hypothetical protein [Actinomadura barringtoniae]MBO2455289.1 hypothetical protein [Actinomadura barringtoniae]
MDVETIQGTGETVRAATPGETWRTKAPAELSMDELAEALDFLAANSTVDDVLGTALARELVARTAA